VVQNAQNLRDLTEVDPGVAGVAGAAGPDRRRRGDPQLAVGISPGTVKSGVHYALLALRKELAPTLRIIGVGPPPRATSPATG
jgi:hypothetical protein